MTTNWYDVYDKMQVEEIVAEFSDRVVEAEVPEVEAQLIEQVGEDILRHPGFVAGLMAGLMAGVRVAVDPDLHHMVKCPSPDLCDTSSHPMIEAATMQDILIYNITASHRLFTSYRAIDELAE